MAGCEVGRTRVLGGLIRLIWENGATLLADEDGLLPVWDPQVLGIWCYGARESQRVYW